MLPMVKNPSAGYIQNCNNTPYQPTIGDENPIEENISPTFGIETHMTNRALRAFETYGKDDRISYDEFKQYKFDLFYSKKSYMAQYVKRSSDLLNKDNFPNFVPAK